MSLEALLQPISGDAPCGADLSFSTEFDTLQELRRDDDPTLPQGEFVAERKVADWPGVAELCTRLLETRSKDLQLAGWLLEAWSRQRGFGGLADGLSLVEQLCLRFWGELHPGGGDGEQELRIGSLTWVLSRTESVTRIVSLLRSGSSGIGLARIDVLKAQQAAAARGEAETGEGKGLSATEDLALIQRETPREFFAANLAEAERTLAALDGLQTTLDTLLDDDSPNFVSTRKALDAAVHAARRYAREAGVSSEAAAADSGGTDEAGQAPALARPAALQAEGPLQTRAQALRQLRSVAEFFRRTEPHSPVAYLADKAARWGEMPLHDWLRAVIKDNGALTQLEDLLGVVPARDGANP